MWSRKTFGKILELRAVQNVVLPRKDEQCIPLTHQCFKPLQNAISTNLWNCRCNNNKGNNQLLVTAFSIYPKSAVKSGHNTLLKSPGSQFCCEVRLMALLKMYYIWLHGSQPSDLLQDRLSCDRMCGCNHDTYIHKSLLLQMDLLWRTRTRVKK